MSVSLSAPSSDNDDIFARRDLRNPQFASWKPAKELKGGHHRAVRCLAWSCDGRRLATGGSDKAVRVWQPERASMDRSSGELRGHTDTVEAMAWDPTHPEQLATASLDRTVRLWDTRTQQSIFTTPTPGTNINITFHPKGHLLAVGNRDDVLSLIDVRASPGRILGTIKATPQVEEVNEFAWNNSGSIFVATTGNGFVRILDARAHNDPATVAAMVEEETRKAAEQDVDMTNGSVASAATAASKSSIIDWPPVHTLVAHTATVFCGQFDPLGRYLVTSGADSMVACWTLPEHQSHWMAGSDLQHPPRSISFSHDGEFIAAGGEDPFVWIGSTVDGRRLHKVPTMGTINALSWCPTRHLLAYAGEDKGQGHEGTVRVWGL